MGIKRNKSIKISDCILVKIQHFHWRHNCILTELNNISELSLRISLDKGEYAKHRPDGGMYLFINLTDF